MRWERTGRQAPTSPRRTVAWGNETPMNPAKWPEVCSLCSPYDARVTEVSCRAGFIHSPALLFTGRGFISNDTWPAYMPTQPRGWL